MGAEQKIKIQLKGFNFFPAYHTKMLGVIHKWIGENNVHDTMSLYSFSHIRKGGYFFFTAYDNKLISRVLHGITNDPVLWEGVIVTDLKVQNSFLGNDKEIFSMSSPVLLKEYTEHVTDIKRAPAIAKRILNKKAKSVGLDLGDYDIEFVNFEKTKLVGIHHIKNRAFYSDVHITGSEIAKRFALQVGLGNSTGSGFGFINQTLKIYTNEN